MDTNWDKPQGSDTYKQLMQVEIIIRYDYIELQHEINNWIKNHAYTHHVTSIDVNAYKSYVSSVRTNFIGTINYTTAVKIK